MGVINCTRSEILYILFNRRKLTTHFFSFLILMKDLLFIPNTSYIRNEFFTNRIQRRVYITCSKFFSQFQKSKEIPYFILLQALGFVSPGTNLA